MADKRIALTDYLSLDGTDVSDLCDQITSADDDELVDVSGFNPTGTDETLPGKRAQSITVEFYGGPTIHNILYPAHRDRATIAIVWRKDSGAVSSSNPELTGNVKVPSYGQGAVRGDVEKFTITMPAADSTGLVWSAT